MRYLGMVGGSLLGLGLSLKGFSWICMPTGGLVLGYVIGAGVDYLQDIWVKSGAYGVSVK